MDLSAYWRQLVADRRPEAPLADTQPLGPRGRRRGRLHEAQLEPPTRRTWISNITKVLASLDRPNPRVTQRRRSLCCSIHAAGASSCWPSSPGPGRLERHGDSFFSECAHISRCVTHPPAVHEACGDP